MLVLQITLSGVVAHLYVTCLLPCGLGSNLDEGNWEREMATQKDHFLDSLFIFSSKGLAVRIRRMANNASTISQISLHL